MAAIFLSPPGTEYGPCAEGCVHRDCAASRRQAVAPCTECHEPIGYDIRFYQDGDTGNFVHAACLEAWLSPAKVTQP